MLTANIAYWLDKAKQLIPKIEKLQASREVTARQEKAADIDMSKNANTMSKEQSYQQSMLVKALRQKSVTMAQRIEDLSSQRRWIALHLRGNYRRLSILKRKYPCSLYRTRVNVLVPDRPLTVAITDHLVTTERFQSTIKRMEWVVVEGHTVRNQFIIALLHF